MMFKPGDKVRRKKDFRNGSWNRYAKIPDKILTVIGCQDGVILSFDEINTFNAGFFELAEVKKVLVRDLM